MIASLITSRGVSVRSYVTGVDHTVAKSDEELLAGAVAAALNKAEEEKLASVSGRFLPRMELTVVHPYQGKTDSTTPIDGVAFVP